MKIVCISDSHQKHPYLPEGDLLLHAGDLTATGTLKQFEEEVGWLREAKQQFPLGVLFVPGNHDKGMDLEFVDRKHLAWTKDPYHHYVPAWSHGDRSKIFKLFEQAGINVLVDQAVEIEGIKFWGSPWTPTFFDWGFMHDEIDLGAVWQKIPTSTDILITHGPPKFILDRCPNGSVGSQTLAHAVKELKVKAHIFGHIHEGAGCTNQWGTTFVNASVLDGKYRGFNKIQILDTETWKVA